MELFKGYLAAIENESHRARLREVLLWVCGTFPELDTRIAWKQPMFTHHGTFIIGFSVSKQHFSISPEAQSIAAFSDAIAESGYSRGSNLFRIKWTDSVDYALLETLIRYNLEEKKDCATFWRP